MARLKAGFTGERRTAHLGVDLTPSERRELAVRAEQSGLLVSEYVRAAVFTQPIRPTRGMDAQAMRELLLEFSRIGVNLNQIAKQFNQTGELRREAALRLVIDQLVEATQRVITL